MVVAAARAGVPPPWSAAAALSVKRDSCERRQGTERRKGLHSSFACKGIDHCHGLQHLAGGVKRTGRCDTIR